MNENDYIVNAFTKEGNNTNLEVNNLNVGCITSKDNNFELDSSGNLTVKSLTAGDIRVTSQIVRDLMYPVGFIYFSVDKTNPGELIGGEWEQIKDTFLLASGDKYIGGATGGEEKHKLTIEEMPSHNHRIPNSGSLTPGWVGLYRNNASDDDSSGFVRNVGGDQAHNNMPPYLVVYIWKRIK